MSSPQLSTYEQLEALERAEQAQASATGRPPIAGSPPARAELFGGPAPPPREDLPADVPLLGGLMTHTLDPEPDLLATTEEAPLLPAWSPSSGKPASAAARGRERPSAPRPYVPLTAPLAAPPSQKGPVLIGVGLGALVAIGVVLVLLSPAQTEEVAAPVPEPVAVALPVVAPPPKPAPPIEPGRLRFTGVPRGARVAVDGAPVANPAAENPFSGGTHQVLVELKGYAKYEAAVDLAAGELKVVAVTLKKARKKR